MVSDDTKLKSHFSLEQRVFMVEEYFKFRSYVICATRFRERFPGCSPPQKPTIYRAVTRFRRTGSVLDRKRVRTSTILDEQTLDEVRQRLIDTPNLSVRKLSSLTKISYGSAHRALTMLKKEQTLADIKEQQNDDDSSDA